MSRTLWLEPDGRLLTLDQTRLPFRREVIELRSRADCEHAIVTMQVRGAPLIGAVAAYGLAFALREAAGDDVLDRAAASLAATRPTAVNLRWALERVSARVRRLAPAQRAHAAWLEAGALCEDDVACNAAIGRHSAALLAPLVRPGRPLQVLTHCNAGRLATVDHGTALAGVYALAGAGVPLHVWVDETRPRNQGASLTAWELRERGVPYTVIADNAGGLLMRQGRVDAVIVGCDRVAANGDVANKIGTYLKALAARDTGVPFFVACPVSTIDSSLPDGEAIPIEERSAREITHVTVLLDGGRTQEGALMPPDTPALNPAFDVTPARLVTALVTEHGACDASPQGVARVLVLARAGGPKLR